LILWPYPAHRSSGTAEGGFSSSLQTATFVQAENMATIGFIGHSEALFNQTVLEAQASRAATRSNASAAIFSAATIADEFTPSAQGAEQAAGIFSQFSTAAVAELAPANSATLETATAATTNPVAAPVATPANSEAQLQLLNTALGELGSSNANINKTDGTAVLINNFNPATFTFLANRLKPSSPSHRPQPQRLYPREPRRQQRKTRIAR
jgi:hypothetical protein